MPLQLATGKFYRTAHNRKAEVIYHDLKSGNFVVVHKNNGDAYILWHLPNGKDSLTESESTFDLTAEWTEKPEFDWSVLNQWKALFQLPKDGKWTISTEIPTIRDDGWELSLDAKTFVLPSDYAPKNYTGPWQDSLLVREGV